MLPVERIKAIPLFSELTDEELAHLAPHFHHIHGKQGDIVTRQGDEGGDFVVLENGTLRVTQIDAQGREKVLGYMSAPQFFGETSLVTGVHRDATTDVFSSGVDLLVLPKVEFQGVVVQHPDILKRLALRADVQRRLAQRLYPWLSDGEVVLVNTRRHLFALASRLFVPLLLTIALLIAATVLAQFPTGMLPGAIFLLAIVWTLGIGAWIIVDWSNDFFIVTNKRVIHIEKTIFFFDAREEAPIEMVTNVVETVTSVPARLFGFTELRVETAGRQVEIDFTYTPRRAQVRQRIFEQIGRIKERSAMEEREHIRAGIRSQLQERLAPDQVSAPTQTPPPSPEPVTTVRSSGVGKWLRAGFSLRLDEPHQTTWHKHWVILIERVDTPVDILLALLVVGIAHASGLVPLRALGGLANDPIVKLLLIGGWVIAFAAAAFAAWYQYEDWNNDLYRVTTDRVVDLEKSPFGFEERSVETTLDRVQDVSYVRQGPIAVLFNFGDLIIETAGAGRLTFYYIQNPRAAVQEIFRRRDSHLAARSRTQGDQSRREFLDWFMEYHRFLQERGEINPPSIPPTSPPSSPSTS